MERLAVFVTGGEAVTIGPAELKASMDVEAVFLFAKDLEARGRSPKYISDQVWGI